MKLMTADQVRAALSVRDLTDPNQGPHAMQLLSARARLVDSFSPVREDFLK